MFITITLIGGSLLMSYYYKERIAWYGIKLYTILNKTISNNSTNKNEDKNINENENIIINDILYIDHNGSDISDELINKIKNKNLTIIDNDFIEINNKKININEISIINNKGEIFSLKNYL